MSIFRRSPGRGGALALLLACALPTLLASCAATRSGTGAGGDAAGGGTGLVIVDLHAEPASDPSLVKLVGTIVNKTDQPVSRLSVKVEARDAQGRALTRVITPSLSDTIPPQGGTALFEANLPRSNLVHDYFAEVMPQ
ncbi:MAG TPA: FxLYD domain-containing protein [Candidatus Binatia bacterium]